MRSASVDLPWSMWAMIEKLRMWEAGGIGLGPAAGARERRRRAGESYQFGPLRPASAKLVHALRATRPPSTLRLRSTAPALPCRGLVKRYGDLVAVDGLDLEVRAGECFGLLGPNGAGKTTTVELFEGLLSPDGGTLEVLGQRWQGDGQALRARLGVQLQETRFPEKLRVDRAGRALPQLLPRRPRAGGGAGARRPRGEAAGVRARALRRPEAAPVARLRAGRRSGGALPRRADHRARPGRRAARSGRSSSG